VIETIGIVAGCLIAWRISFRAVTDMLRSDFSGIDVEDVVAAAAISLFGFWFIAPLAICAWAIRLIPGSDNPEAVVRILGGESRSRKRARIQAERDAAQRRVRQLEQQLGIGQSPPAQQQ
jgi:hypothetical protein